MASMHEAFEAFEAIARAAGPAGDIRRIVDLGCGPGVAAVALAQRFADAVVTAVDGSAELLQRASDRAARFGVGELVDTRIADFGPSLDGLAAAGTVDLVWVSMVLHHLAELPRTLAELHGLLRPNGLMAVVEKTLTLGAMEQDWRALLTDAGFDVVDHREFALQLPDADSGPPGRSAHRDGVSPQTSRTFLLARRR
jgi:trans-aconitate methyltransferase